MNLDVSLSVIIFIACQITRHIVSGQELPKLSPFVLPSNLAVGSTVQVFCTAYAGRLPLNFSFLKDGKHLSIEIQQLADYAVTFTLNPLKLEHIGNYTCIASNVFGSDQATAPLFVAAPPIWVIEPSDVNIKRGDSAILNCVAEGSPAVHTIWQKKLETSELVPLNPSSHLKVLHNNSLAVSNAKKSDSGVFVCEASNGIGDKLSKDANVVVYEYPNVQKTIDHVTVEKGKTAHLSCIASGDMPLSLLWTKDGKQLNDWPEALNRISFSEQPSSDNIKFMLTVKKTELEDEGLYTCMAKNAFGSDDDDVRLMLVERPQAPQYVEVVDVWSRSVRLKWSAPKNGNSAILSYTVEFWTTSGGGHWNETFPSSSTSTILRNLNPFTLYHFHVYASNSVGDSLPSSETKFTTAQEEPSAPPVDVRIEEVGSTFLRISWKPPPHQDWNGAINGYYIGYKHSSSKLPFTFNTVEPEEELIYYILRGLRRATRYIITVRAFNDIGSGPPSEELSFKTHNQEPPPQPILMVKEIGSTYMQIHWILLNEAKFQTTGYSINYRKNGEKWQEISVPDVTQNVYTLTNLDSGVPYQVFVTSLGTSGISEPSEIATVRTSAEAIFGLSHSTPAPVQTAVDDMTQILYIVIPVAVATVIIVTVIVGACVYVYSKRPIPTFHPYGDLPASKNFSYMSTAPRKREPPMTVCGGNTMKQGSPYSTVPLTRTEPDEDEPIYESVMEEIRCKIKQRSFDEEMKLGGAGTIV